MDQSACCCINFCCFLSESSFKLVFLVLGDVGLVISLLRRLKAGGWGVGGVSVSSPLWSVNSTFASCSRMDYAAECSFNLPVCSGETSAARWDQLSETVSVPSAEIYSRGGVGSACAVAPLWGLYCVLKGFSLGLSLTYCCSAGSHAG